MQVWMGQAAQSQSAAGEKLVMCASTEDPCCPPRFKPHSALFLSLSLSQLFMLFSYRRITVNN